VKNEVAGGQSSRSSFPPWRPPLFARKDKVTGLPRKMTLGPWMLPALPGGWRKFKVLRGTVLDIFRLLRGAPHRAQAWIADYEALLD